MPNSSKSTFGGHPIGAKSPNVPNIGTHLEDFSNKMTAKSRLVPNHSNALSIGVIHSHQRHLQLHHRSHIIVRLEISTVTFHNFVSLECLKYMQHHEKVSRAARWGCTKY